MKSRSAELLAIHAVPTIFWVASLFVLSCCPFVIRALPWQPDNPLYWIFGVLAGVLFAGLPVVFITTVTAWYVRELVRFFRKNRK